MLRRPPRSTQSRSSAASDVYKRQSETTRLSETLIDQVAHYDRGRAEELRGVSRSQTDRACACDVDGGSGTDARRVSPVKTGREDVRQHREVLDLGHRLVLVGELQEIEVGVRDHYVFGLAANPSAHVDIAVGRPGTGRI